jgi:hypothetical protein
MPSEEVLNAGYDAARDQNGLPPEGLVLGHVGKIFVAMINAEVEEQVSKPSIPCEPDPVGIFHAYDQPIEYLHSHDLHAGDQLFVRKVA